MRVKRWLLGSLVAVALLIGAANAGRAATGSVQATWKTAVIISMTLMPNFQSGFGPVGGPPSPAAAPGPSASLGGGYVDFGKVVQGYNYLYKYALQVAVLSNDANGFQVFAQGATDFQSASSGTWPVGTTLFWLPTNAANTPFSPAVAFTKTTATVTGSGSSTGINYGGANPPTNAIVWSYPSSTIGLAGNTANEDYDYELQLSGSIPVTQFSVYVVYTVVAT